MTHNKEFVNFDSFLTNSINLDQQNVKLIYSTESTNGIRNENFVPEDDVKLRLLLRSFELEEIYNDLRAARISFKNLKYLNRNDIKEVIKPVGLRAEFRQKLFSYLKSENAVDEENFSNNSKVITWLGKGPMEDSPSSSHSQFHSGSLNSASGLNINSAVPLNAFQGLNKNCETGHISPSFLNKQTPSLSSLLQSSARGNDILTFYKNNSCLTKKQRDDMIQIILEEVVENRGIKLRPESFIQIIQEIVSIFPNEKKHQDYYFIPRQQKKNPSGRLYCKYFNLKTKRKKWDTSAQSSNSVEEPEVRETDLKRAKTT